MTNPAQNVPELAQSAPPHLSSRCRACGLFLVGAVPLGLLWRLAPLHLPAFAFKYGGSALWAMAVYWTAALLLPRLQPRLLAPLAAAIAASVECFKQVRSPALNAFRATLAGKLLLGRYFSVGALLAYGLAITLVAGLDAFLKPGRRP